MDLIREPIYGGDQRSNRFRIRKAAQVVGALLHANGGSADMYYINKLAYLAERQMLLEYSTPLFFDRLNNLQYGPLASGLRDCTKDEMLYRGVSWCEFISKPQKNTLVISGDISKDELSNGEIGVILDVKKELDEYIKSNSNKFQGNEFRIVHNYVMQLPEYVEIKETDERKSLPIYYETVLSGAGISEADIKDIVYSINASELMPSI